MTSNKKISNSASLGINTKINSTNIIIEDDVKIGNNVTIESGNVFIGKGCIIKDNSEFKCKNLIIDPLAKIMESVKVDVDFFHIGYKTLIEENCRFSGIRSCAKKIEIGDFTFIGNDSRFLIPELYVGDYTAIHNHILVNGYEICKIGHNSYVGQHSVLNASEKLLMGNNVRLALNCYIWTHVESGELIEGCTLYGRKPVIIEDDVWLTGCNISISPGVILGKGSIIFHGSIVTKSTEPKRCYAGIPAKDITDKIKPYREVTLDDKFEMMKIYINEFYEKNPLLNNQITLIENFPEKFNAEKPHIIIAKHGKPKDYGESISSFSLDNKQYIKKRTELEESFIRFNVGCRARFIPI